jgi:hypothetical protein
MSQVCTGNIFPYVFSQNLQMKISAVFIGESDGFLYSKYGKRKLARNLHAPEWRAFRCNKTEFVALQLF